MLPKLSPDDDVEVYLYTFKQTASYEGWPEKEWAKIMAPLLTSKTQFAFYALLPVTADDYNLLKEKLMACCRLSPSQVVAEFHQQTFRANFTLWS